MRNTWTWAVVALLLWAPAAAQEKTEPEPPKSATPPRANWITPLKVQLVLSKYHGDKKVTSLPYEMTCNADDRKPVQLRMGIEVPVPVMQPKEGVASFQYRSVGTNIDCGASTLQNGLFRLELTVEHSSVYSPLEEQMRRASEPPREGAPSAPAIRDVTGGAPVFRNFRTTFNPVLRDRQTVQYTAATDPVSGEVVKIEVTATVLK